MVVYCKLCAKVHPYKNEDIRESVGGLMAIALPCGFLPLNLVEFRESRPKQQKYLYVALTTWYDDLGDYTTATYVYESLKMANEYANHSNNSPYNKEENRSVTTVHTVTLVEEKKRSSYDTWNE